MTEAALTTDIVTTQKILGISKTVIRLSTVFYYLTIELITVLLVFLTAKHQAVRS